MNNLFTILFLIFLIGANFKRYSETFIVKGKEAGEIKLKWSFKVLTTVYILCMIASVIEYFVVRRNISFLVTGIAFFMYLTGAVSTHWAIKTLGGYHSVHIEIRNKHPLIKNGPYRYLRHPYYLGVMLQLLGIVLIPNSYFSFVFSLLVYVPLMFIRVRFEEKAMIEKFGDEYLQYMKEVPGLIPVRRT